MVIPIANGRCVLISPITTPCKQYLLRVHEYRWMGVRRKTNTGGLIVPKIEARAFAEQLRDNGFVQDVHWVLVCGAPV